MANILRRLWKKWVHWYRYRNKPVFRIDVSYPPTMCSYAKIYIKSKEEHGKETTYLDALCNHYNCEFGVETADICILVFNDKRLYTMFMLKYGECL